MKKGEILAYVHSNKEELIQNAKEKIEKAYKITKEKAEEYIDILNII